MKKLILATCSSCIVMLLALSASAQRITTTNGEATIEVAENVTLAQAQQIARDQAIIDALQRAFGTSIVQGRITRVESTTRADSASSTTYFNLIADSYVRGEWIETTSEQFEQFLKNTNGKQQIWLKCTIRGTAREIEEARPQLQLEALNCASTNCATAKFLNGDRLYVNVKSPTDGFLQLYLEDGDTVYNILPYQRMPTGQQESFKLTAQQNYILFSNRPEHNYFEQPNFQEDELELTVEGSVQSHQRLYAIFSTTSLPKPYLRPGTLYQDGSSKPRNITRTQFQEWLSYMKLASNTFYVQTLDFLVVN